MSEIEVLEQGGDSPSGREVDTESRKGREHYSPSDQEITPSDDDDQRMVEVGDWARDTAVVGIGDDAASRRSADLRQPCPSPVAVQQRSLVGTTTAQQLRSVVTRPIQQRPTNGRGRATIGADVQQPSRPGRDYNAAGGDQNSTLQY